MREIKFKLYNRRDKKMYVYDPHWGNFGQGGGWVGGVLLCDYKRKGRTFAPSNQWQLEPEECEWLEFTGLLDKNDKEIYESDIVKLFNRDANKATIQWADSEAGYILKWLTPLSEDTEGIIAHVDRRGVEVIGNIYENPELLEGFIPYKEE